MINILYSFGSIVFYLLIYLLFGALFLNFFKSIRNFLALSLITGFFIYYGVFQLLALPMILLQCSLSMLSLIWWIAVSVISIISIILNHKRLGKEVLRLKKAFFNKDGLLAVAVLLVIGQIILININDTISADTAYYIGNVTTSVYTNTMNLYHPYTGYPLTEFNLRYLPATYNIHDAVFCQTFGIHPLIAVKTVMTTVIIIISNMIIFQIGTLLFDKMQKYAPVIFLAFYTLFQFFNHTGYSAATFFYHRTSEGKSLVANIIIPAVIYTLLYLYKKHKSSFAWAFWAIIAWSCNALSMTSVLIVPVAMFAGTSALLIIKKDTAIIPRYFICLFINIIGIVYFVAYSLDLFSITIRW